MIRPELLDQVKVGLESIGIHGMTAYEVRGRGEQKGLEFTHRAGVFRVDMLPKVKVEIVVEDEDEERVIEAILDSAHTGEIGDGKIFVTPVQRAVRIRTREDWRYRIAP